MTETQQTHHSDDTVTAPVGESTEPTGQVDAAWEAPDPASAQAASESPAEAADTAQNETEQAPPAPPVDYARMAEQDLREIQRIAPALAGLEHLSELPNATRYAALRDAGLSVEEAFWAACHAAVRAPYDNRSHLHSAVPRGAAGNPVTMSAAELHAAQELFDDLTDAEIQRLYARCRG